MQINNIDKDSAELILNKSEIDSLIKMLEFALKELEYEYFTRTGFYETDTQELIKKFTGYLQIEDEEIKAMVSHKEIFNLRQNLNEILYAIQIENYDLLFGMSENTLDVVFKLIDKYEDAYRIWN